MEGSAERAANGRTHDRARNRTLQCSRPFVDPQRTAESATLSEVGKRPLEKDADSYVISSPQTPTSQSRGTTTQFQPTATHARTSTETNPPARPRAGPPRVPPRR